MAKKKTKLQETLSRETPQVQEKILSELFGTDVDKKEIEEVKEEVREEVKEEVKEEVREEIPEEVKEEIKEEVKEEGLKPKDRVKINPEIGNDILGRRIHNGIKNYLYTVKNVRADVYVTIECLTYIFTLPAKDLTLIKRG